MDWNRSGGNASTGKRDSNYPEMELSDTNVLPLLPNTWCWSSIQALAESIVDCPHSTAAFVSSGYGCVDTTCIAPGELVIERMRFVDEQTFLARTKRLVPQKGDIVFAREGTVGTAVSLPAEPQVCLGQRVMLIRPARVVLSKYMELCLRSTVTKNQYRSKLLGTTVPHLNVRDVIKLAMPVPPLAEQQHIIDVVEELLSELRRIERYLILEVRRAARMRQAVLTAAFSGKLVPQDPNDEPAFYLLERIAAERASSNGVKPRPRHVKQGALL